MEVHRKLTDESESDLGPAIFGCAALGGLLVLYLKWNEIYQFLHQRWPTVFSPNPVQVTQTKTIEKPYRDYEREQVGIPIDQEIYGESPASGYVMPGPGQTGELTRPTQTVRISGF